MISPAYGAIYPRPTGPRAVPLLPERKLHERRFVPVLARDCPRELSNSTTMQHYHRNTYRLEKLCDDMPIFPGWKLPRRRRVRVFA